MSENGGPLPTKQTSTAIFKEVGSVYATVILIIIGFSIVSQFVGFIGEFLYAVVAGLFYFVPHRLIHKRGWKYEDFAIRTDRRKLGLLWGFGATLITIPFFLGGFWVWEAMILGHEFDVDVSRYKQFSGELSGAPKTWGKSGEGVWIWSQGDRLNVGVSNDGKSNNRVFVSSTTPFEIERRGALTSTKRTSTETLLTLTHSKSRGSVSITGANDVKVRIEPVVEGNDVWPMYVGPTAEKVSEFSESRGYFWLLLWIATQLLLVAFPEEYFYRGYIQTRLKQGFGLREKEGKKTYLGFWGFGPSIFFASLAFGLGHLLVPVGGAILATRMMVFFPSLVFGWLRDKTGSILASTIYHTCCNLMVLIGAVHFI